MWQQESESRQCSPNDQVGAKEEKGENCFEGKDRRGHPRARPLIVWIEKGESAKGYSCERAKEVVELVKKMEHNKVARHVVEAGAKRPEGKGRGNSCECSRRAARVAVSYNYREGKKQCSCCPVCKALDVGRCKLASRSLYKIGEKRKHIGKMKCIRKKDVQKKNEHHSQEREFCSNETKVQRFVLHDHIRGKEYP